MDNVTQQMKGVTLSGDANNNDTNDFNAGLFQYILLIASNASNLEVIDWSEAKKQSKRLQLQANQHPERIKVLDHIKFPWTTGTQQERWSMHYEELVEFYATNGHCNVHRAAVGIFTDDAPFPIFRHVCEFAEAEFHVRAQPFLCAPHLAIRNIVRIRVGYRS
jgi:hypothetical protein